MRVESEKYPGYTLEENLKRALMEMLFLSLLSEKESYIGELVERLAQRSGKSFSVVFPYGAIYRAEAAGHVCLTEKRVAPDGRRRQFLALTPEGFARLKVLKETYARFISGVDAVLEGANSDNRQ